MTRSSGGAGDGVEEVEEANEEDCGCCGDALVFAAVEVIGVAERRVTRGKVDGH